MLISITKDITLHPVSQPVDGNITRKNQPEYHAGRSPPAGAGAEVPDNHTGLHRPRLVCRRREDGNETASVSPPQRGEHVRLNGTEATTRWEQREGIAPPAFVRCAGRCPAHQGLRPSGAWEDGSANAADDGVQRSVRRFPVVWGRKPAFPFAPSVREVLRRPCRFFHGDGPPPSPPSR
ncbi:MAG: hypothetical protein JWQ98_3162 [Chlorobi bacterium]|nr:hypothetical protein [Chlorobiota bacterium]